MVFLEQHAKQLKSGNGNDQNNGARHANHKHPAQDMSSNGHQGIKHIDAPEPIGEFCQGLFAFLEAEQASLVLIKWPNSAGWATEVTDYFF
jgi:hypothetical protein